MSFHLSFTPRDGYLEIGLSGEWSLDGLYELIDATRRETERTGLSRVLCDGRGMSGQPTEMARFKAGVRTAEVLGAKIRLALVSRPETITRFGENAAVNRGASLKVFSDAAEALVWLMADSPPRG